MAGNTKFIGFLPGNRVQLERWGSTVQVALSIEDINALREALQKDLPSKPPQAPADRFGDFVSKYDEQFGRVVASLTPDATTYLADLLEVLVKDDVHAMDKVRPWIESMRAAVQGHVDFHNVSEPGVKQ